MLCFAVAGLYPVIGWKIKDEVMFLAEGSASDAGTCLEWVRSIGQSLMLAALKYYDKTSS